MADSDMVMCIYNPSSRRRSGYLKEACDIVLKVQSPRYSVRLCKKHRKKNETTGILTLKELADFKSGYVYNNIHRQQPY